MLRKVYCNAATIRVSGCNVATNQSKKCYDNNTNRVRYNRTTDDECCHDVSEEKGLDSMGSIQTSQARHSHSVSRPTGNW